MTEMLGVLAIIGILSIGALLGYQYGITKYQATSTVEELSRRAVLISSQTSLSNNTVVDEMGSKTLLGYPIETVLSQSNHTIFWLNIENVPKRVCKQILDLDWKAPFTITVNDILYENDTSLCIDGTNTNQLGFEFNALNMDGDEPITRCQSNSDCTGCDICQDHICMSGCNNNERCAIDYDTGSKMCCSNEKISGAYCCANIQNGMCCNSSGACCPWTKPLQDTNGNCYACDYGSKIFVRGVLDRCNICENRELLGEYCVLKCPDDKPLRDSAGNCHSCDDTVSIQLGNPDDCFLCSQRTLGGENNRYCVLKCGEGIYKDKPLLDARGVCHSCSEKENFNVTGVEENCGVCDNRDLVGSMCVHKCPSHEPLPDMNGGCHACKDPDPVRLSAANVCSVCPNRVSGGSFNLSCYLPCGEGIYKDKPMPDVMGVCHSCEETAAINVYLVRDNCSICKNRVLEGDQCNLPCPDNKPLADAKGVCHACDEDASFEMGVDTSLCRKKCPMRILEGYWHNYCAAACGQGGFANKPLADETGSCFSCEEPTAVNVRTAPQKCSVCENREIKGDYCVLTL